MSFVSPFIFIPALVLLIGILFNTRALFRKLKTTRYAEKANSVAICFAVVSFSLPLLLFINAPNALRLVVWGACAGNFIVGVIHIVRWFGGAKRAEQDAQERLNAKKSEKR